MEREVYREMRVLQREHWWFLGRRRVLTALLGGLGLRKGARILEAGAGSGGNVPMLQAFGDVSAFDMDAEAAGYCRLTLSQDPAPLTKLGVGTHTVTIHAATYVGARTVTELAERATVGIQTMAGFTEGTPHGL